MANTITVRVLGDASGFNKATQQVDKGVGGLKSKVLKLGAAIGGAFAVQQVAQFGADAVKAAVEDEKSQKQLANTLQNVAGARKDDIDSVESWISAQGRALGVTDEKLRPALATLATVTGDVGKAQELASLAMDISAATGKDLESVAKDLGKASNGQVAALKKYGIQVKNADGTTKSFAELQAELATKMNGAADTAANTAGGKFARFQVQMDELKESIGAKLIPVLLKIGDFLLTKVIPAIEVTVAWISENWPKVQEVITSVVQKMWDYVKPIIDTMKRAWRIFGDDVRRLVSEKFEAMKLRIQGVLDIILGTFRFFRAIFKGEWGKAWEAIKQVFTGVWNTIKGTLGDAIASIKFVLATIGKVIIGVISTPLNKVKDFIDGVVDDIIGFFRDMPTTIGNVLRGAANAILWPFRTAFNLFADLWNNSIGKFSFHIPRWVPGFGGSGWDMPDMPKIEALAEGGIVNRPTLALIGEAGPEAVVPLRGRNARGMGNTYYLTVNALAPQQASTAVIEAIRAYERSNGNGWRN